MRKQKKHPPALKRGPTLSGQASDGGDVGANVLRILDLTQSGQTRTFSYLSVDQKQYSLERLTGSFVNTNWSPIQSLTGDGGTQTMRHIVKPYRTGVLPTQSAVASRPDPLDHVHGS